MGDDLISTLITAHYEGDRLSDTELVNLPRRLGPIELDGEPEFGSVNGIYQLDRLPLRFG